MQSNLMSSTGRIYTAVEYTARISEGYIPSTISMIEVERELIALEVLRIDLTCAC